MTKLLLLPILLFAQVVNTGAYRKVFSAGGGGACGTYAHYRVITIPTQSALSGNLSNYPVLISGTYSYLATVANGGLVQNGSGFDVAFYADNTCATKLNWEVETYTAASGLVNYWVQVPSISKTASVTFVMAYDNSSISTDQSNKTATWDADYLAIYHLPNGTTLSPNTSTSGSFNGTPTNATATTGEIDGAASFVGTGKILIPAGLNGSLSFTYSAWINGTSWSNAYTSVISEDEGSSCSRTILVKSSGKMAMYAQCGSVGNDYDGTGTHTLSTSTWNHVTFTCTTGGVGTGYVNGAVDGSFNTGTICAGSATTTHIADSSITSRNFSGKIDEVRVSDVARSADWILTDYNSQSSPATFYSVGIEH